MTDQVYAHPALDAPTLVRAAARLDHLGLEMYGECVTHGVDRGRAWRLGQCVEACEAAERAIFRALGALAHTLDHPEALALVEDWSASKRAAGAGR